MTEAELETHYPIREFSKITGVNPVTLRAWERRYGIIQPKRTAKGHRFYNNQHVDKVKNILYWLDQGYPIRQVKLLLHDPIIKIDDVRNEWSEQQEVIYQAAVQLKSQQLDELWTEGLINYPAMVYFQHCLLPVLDRVHELGEQPLITKSFEHLLKRKLYSLIAQQQKYANGTEILLATNHSNSEIFLLFTAYALGVASFKVHYFGTDLSSGDVDLAMTSLNLQYGWMHLHPSDARHANEWAHILENSASHWFLSGALPHSLQERQHLTRLPEDLGEQVQVFLTSIGGQL